jgi:hypothetical protein
MDSSIEELFKKYKIMGENGEEIEIPREDLNLVVQYKPDEEDGIGDKDYDESDDEDVREKVHARHFNPPTYEEYDCDSIPLEDKGTVVGEDDFKLTYISENLEDEDSFREFLAEKNYNEPFVLMHLLLIIDAGDRMSDYTMIDPGYKNSIKEQLKIMYKCCGIGSQEIMNLVVKHAYVIISCLLELLVEKGGHESNFLIQNIIECILQNESDDDEDFTNHMMLTVLNESVDLHEEFIFRHIINNDRWYLMKDTIYALLEDHEELLDIVRTSENEDLKSRYD